MIYLLFFLLLALPSRIDTSQDTGEVVISRNPLVKFHENLLTKADTSFLLSIHPPLTASPHNSKIYTGESRSVQSGVRIHRTSNAAGTLCRAVLEDAVKGGPVFA